VRWRPATLPLRVRIGILTPEAFEGLLPFPPGRPNVVTPASRHAALARQRAGSRCPAGAATMEFALVTPDGRGRHRAVPALREVEAARRGQRNDRTYEKHFRRGVDQQSIVVAYQPPSRTQRACGNPILEQKPPRTVCSPLLPNCVHMPNTYYCDWSSPKCWSPTRAAPAHESP
jgi:hypothetical protein